MVYSYEMFTQTLNDYKAFVNPIGYELYESQFEYLNKKSIGYDFKQDKKKNRNPNDKPKVEVKKR